MYTIGQIANIIGISKDKLRYYEEKEILKPKQKDENNYRQYDISDIDTVLAIEFYRSLDLGFKTINELCKDSNIEGIKDVLDKKHSEVMNEIDRLKSIASRIEKAKKSCDNIQKYLNKFTIKSMPPMKILGEISDFRAYNEFDTIHENKNELNNISIIRSLKRFLTFTEEGIETNKMLVTKEIDYSNNERNQNILKYDKCVYTIVEDGLNYKDVMEKTSLKSLEWIRSNNYKPNGIVIISAILIEFNEGLEKSYLEVYIPIE